MVEICIHVNKGTSYAPVLTTFLYISSAQINEMKTAAVPMIPATLPSFFPPIRLMRKPIIGDKINILAKIT